MQHIFEYLINRKLTAKDDKTSKELAAGDDIATLFAKCVYLAFDGKLDPDDFEYSEPHDVIVAYYKISVERIYSEKIKKKLVKLLQKCTKYYNKKLLGTAFNNPRESVVTAFTDNRGKKDYNFIQLDGHGIASHGVPTLKFSTNCFEKYKELF